MYKSIAKQHVLECIQRADSRRAFLLQSAPQIPQTVYHGQFFECSSASPLPRSSEEFAVRSEEGCAHMLLGNESLCMPTQPADSQQDTMAALRATIYSLALAQRRRNGLSPGGKSFHLAFEWKLPVFCAEIQHHLICPVRFPDANKHS